MRKVTVPVYMASEQVNFSSCYSTNSAVCFKKEYPWCKKINKKPISLNGIDFPKSLSLRSLHFILWIVWQTEVVESTKNRNSIGHLVKAEEIANVFTFLSSPLSVSITGDVIDVSRGTGNALLINNLRWRILFILSRFCYLSLLIYFKLFGSFVEQVVNLTF